MSKWVFVNNNEFFGLERVNLPESLKQSTEMLSIEIEQIEEHLSDSDGFILNDISEFGKCSVEALLERIVKHSEARIILYTAEYSIDKELHWMGQGIDLCVKAPASTATILEKSIALKKQTEVPVRSYINQDIANSKILLVEDTRHDKARIEQALSAHDIEWIQSLATFAEFSLEQRFYDLCIIDIMIGEDEEGGFTVAREISRRTNQPFVFYTAFKTDAEYQQAIEIGALDYLVKGMNIKVMRQTLEKWLRYSRYIREREKKPRQKA